jgi:hypothetical protein
VPLALGAIVDLRVPQVSGMPLARLNVERKRQQTRMGTLPPRYAFVLNPDADTKFTRCPRCETRTNLRKLSLVVHVESFGLVLLGKTCRLCLRCDTLIAHKAELDKLLGTVAKESTPDYLVLGTLDRRTYRLGLTGAASLDDVRRYMSDFKSYWNVEITPAGWHPKTKPGN